MMQLNLNIFTFSKFITIYQKTFTSKNYCFTKAGWPTIVKFLNPNSSFIFGLLIILTSISNLHANSVASECYSCQDDYMISTILCPKSKKDCGQCMKGFEQLNDGSCRYLYHVNHNQNASIPKGYPAILNCTFDTPVHCSWYTNKPIQIRDKYSYVHGNGYNTTNCSLRINEIANHDYGKWSCRSKADSSKDGVKKSTVWLTPTNVINDGFLIPRIFAKHQLETKIKRSSGHYAIYWCSVQNPAPVELQWLIDGQPILATAKFEKTVSGNAYNEMALPVNNIKLGNLLTCMASYPDLQLTFNASIEIAAESIEVPAESTELPVHQQATADVIIISILVVGIVVSIPLSVGVGIVIYRARIRSPRHELETVKTGAKEPQLTKNILETQKDGAEELKPLTNESFLCQWKTQNKLHCKT